ncbi:MAG: Hsp20/alpha crystallin family protein [Planctomycetaceae bacterium]|nr:Hsp20/alpha crystallin family protein [Planctomycetaceae bacterium]
MNNSTDLKTTNPPSHELQKQESPTPEGAEPTRETRLYRPHVDILDSADKVTLRVNLPGVNEERTDLTLEKNILTIRGHIDPPHYEGFELVYGEYGVGDFERSFQLTNEIDREGIQASVRNGILTVELPKVKQASKQKITVAAG